MERHYTKEQILEAYLNQINFGHGWYGVEAAARHYFGKGAAQLTLAEAATLAALPKGPAIYDPSKYPDRARNRRDAILDLMVDAEVRALARPPTPPSRSRVRDGATRGHVACRAVLRRRRQGTGGARRDPRRRTAVTASTRRSIRRCSAPRSRRSLEGTAAVEARPGYRHHTLADHPDGLSRLPRRAPSWRSIRAPAT